jgi:hypothetical protein
MIKGMEARVKLGDIPVFVTIRFCPFTSGYVLLKRMN